MQKPLVISNYDTHWQGRQIINAAIEQSSTPMMTNIIAEAATHHVAYTNTPQNGGRAKKGSDYKVRREHWLNWQISLYLYKIDIRQQLNNKRF